MMKKLIESFPQNIVEALDIAKKSTINRPDREIKNVLICGMGGSGIGGSIVASWLSDELKVPVAIAKDYSIPSFVSENTLIIGSSYSGNTEETIEAVQAALDMGAHLIGITSGGKLEALCKSGGYDVIVVPGGNPPRTALAYSLVQLVNIFVQLGMAGEQRLEELKQAHDIIIGDEEVIHATAKEVANHLHGKVGIIYGTMDYEAVLVRARQQFNENSKYLCWHHGLPEMNHNELVGWGGGDDRFAVLFLDTNGNHPRNDRRIEITKEKIKQRAAIMAVRAKGTSRIVQSIYLINVVDWASWYLSELNNVDAIDIEVIDYLKSELAKF